MLQFCPPFSSLRRLEDMSTRPRRRTNLCWVTRSFSHKIRGQRPCHGLLDRPSAVGVPIPMLSSFRPFWFAIRQIPAAKTGGDTVTVTQHPMYCSLRNNLDILIRESFRNYCCPGREIQCLVSNRMGPHTLNVWNVTERRLVANVPTSSATFGSLLLSSSPTHIISPTNNLTYVATGQVGFPHPYSRSQVSTTNPNMPPNAPSTSSLLPSPACPPSGSSSAVCNCGHAYSHRVNELISLPCHTCRRSYRANCQMASRNPEKWKCMKCRASRFTFPLLPLPATDSDSDSYFDSEPESPDSDEPPLSDGQ